MRAKGEAKFAQTKDFQEKFAKDCRAKGGRWDCSFTDGDSSNPCRCEVEERRFEDKREFSTDEQQQVPPSNDVEVVAQPSDESSTSEGETSSEGASSSETDGSEGSGENSASSTSSGESENSGITGGIVLDFNNKFLNYFYK